MELTLIFCMDSLHSLRLQGAIGSEFKIDASYLSPNVNMAARLEVMEHVVSVDTDVQNMLSVMT